jgi:phage FluMu protein Com
MIQKLECKKCEAQYTSDQVKSGKCPVCRKWLNYVGIVQSDDAGTQIQETASKSTKEYSFGDLVEAQTRTTYAVRSLAVYLFITITTSVLGLLLINLAPETPSFGALVILAGFIWSVTAGISELNKSKP